MSFGKALTLTVAGISDFVASDHVADDELDALANVLRDTLSAVEKESTERFAARNRAAPSSSQIGGVA